MTINAYAAFEAKGKLQPFSFEPAPLGAQEVEVRVTHCGICHSDVHLVDNDWQISSYPLVPGHEAIGIITACGSAVKGRRIGERVGIGWQAGSCMHCEWCMDGDSTCCPERVATAVGRHGAFAESVRADYRFALPIPAALESENAAPLLCGGITVYGALKNSEVRPEMRVGVVGIGGLGHLALQYARAMGCEVTAFSSHPDKSAEALRLGAHHVISSVDAKALASAAASLDLIIVTVHTRMQWPLYLNILRPRGCLCIVGAVNEDIPVSAMSLIDGSKTIRGSAIGSLALIAEMLEFSARHGIKAQTEPMPMKDAQAALQHVREGKARYRVVLVA